MRQASPDGPDNEPDAFTDLDQALKHAERVDFDSPLPPQRRNWIPTVMLAAAIVVLSAAIAYGSAFFAVDRAAVHTDQRVAVLESDLRQRRATAADQNAARDRQIAELRRLVCLFADHAQPRDGDVEMVRAKYACATPTPTPGPSAT
jgi:hypothetical protein